VSDGSETNNSAPVIDSGETHIEVIKGNPSDDELAALIAVLGTLGGGASESAPPERSRWGLPVDKLRYAEFSWQLITLRERVHMRR
jgi:acyl-CoA carboxylase epsilon subunit